jgi:hypothetical protein
MSLSITKTEQNVSKRFTECKWHVVVNGVDQGCYTFAQAEEEALKVKIGVAYVVHEESLTKHFERGEHLAVTRILPNDEEEPQMEICIDGGGEHAKYAR